MKHTHDASYQVHYILANLLRTLNRVIVQGRHKIYVFNNDVQLAHSAINWRDQNLSDIVKDNLKCDV